MASEIIGRAMIPFCVGLACDKPELVGVTVI